MKLLVALLLVGCSEDWSTMPEKMMTPIPTPTIIPTTEATPTPCRLLIQVSTRKKICVG